MSISEDDAFEYEREHERIFGHRPVADLSGRHMCVHPLHDAMQRMIESPGVNLQVQFEYRDMISDDDEVVVDAWSKYDRDVDGWKDQIKRVEAEEARKKSGKTQW